jgi:hypothetical protein
MSDEFKPATRRTILIGAATLAGLAGLAAGTANAAGSMPKANVKYQDTPKDGKVCSNCVYYLPGASAKAKGACKIVAGDISPNGWCNMYAAKPH